MIIRDDDGIQKLCRHLMYYFITRRSIREKRHKACGYMYTPRFRKLSSATPIFIIINFIIIWLGVRSSILADNVLPTMLCNFFYCLLSFNSQSVSNTRIRVAWLIARVVKDNIWIVWFLKCLIRISKVVLRL